LSWFATSLFYTCKNITYDIPTNKMLTIYLCNWRTNRDYFYTIENLSKKKCAYSYFHKTLTHVQKTWTTPVVLVGITILLISYLLLYILFEIPHKRPKVIPRENNTFSSLSIQGKYIKLQFPPLMIWGRYIKFRSFLNTHTASIPKIQFCTTLIWTHAARHTDFQSTSINKNIKKNNYKKRIWIQVGPPAVSTMLGILVRQTLLLVQRL